MQNGRIAEERLIRRPESITLGQSPRATLYVPLAPADRPGLPGRRSLFELKKGRYRLRLGPDMTGRVTIDGTPRSLTELSQSHLDIQEGARGRLEFGDITVLFQMVAAPPERLKPCLPASARGGLGSAMRSEAPVLFTLVGSLVLHVGFVAAAALLFVPADAPKPVNRFMERPLVVDVQFFDHNEEPDMSVDPLPPIVAPQPDQVLADEGPEQPDTATPAPEPTDNPSVAKDPSPTPPPTVASANTKGRQKSRLGPNQVKERRPIRRKNVRDKTLLKFISGVGINGKGGVDTLAKGHAINAKAAFSGNGIRVAESADDGNGFKGGPKSDAVTNPGPQVARVDNRDRVRLKVGRVEKPVEKDEKRVKLRVRTHRPRGTASPGTVSQLSRLFRKRSSAFRTCYEQRLRKVPGLKGKVVIALSIRSNGRLAGVSVESNSTGDSVVAQCIVKKVRSWKLAAGDGTGVKRLTVPIVLARNR
jgi:outer membrane biosynthesis protein TonB